MFTVKTNSGKRTLWLGLGIIIAFAVLLFRVWPQWLRVGVWYVSYYLLVSLVRNIFFIYLINYFRSQLQSLD